LFLLPACTLLVEAGRLVLGQWQSVFAVELDGPRKRQLALQMDGDFDANAGGVAHDRPDRELVELELARQLLVDPEPVRGPMQRLVEAGGKRLRPLLVMLSSRLGTQDDPLRAAALAAAIELLHHATLVHDDYVDQAATRRGRPTVAAREGAARAVAVGDYYFAKATRMIAQLGNPDVSCTIAGAVETICLSQMEDVRLRGMYPGDYATYLRVVRGKTAALFAAACKAGAQLGAAPAGVVERLQHFGDLLGIAFQMTDDLLDYSVSSGKPVAHGQPATDLRHRGCAARSARPGAAGGTAGGPRGAGGAGARGGERRVGASRRGCPRRRGRGGPRARGARDRRRRAPAGRPGKLHRRSRQVGPQPRLWSHPACPCPSSGGQIGGVGTPGDGVRVFPTSAWAWGPFLPSIFPSRCSPSSIATSVPARQSPGWS